MIMSPGKGPVPEFEITYSLSGPPEENFLRLKTCGGCVKD